MKITKILFTVAMAGVTILASGKTFAPVGVVKLTATLEGQGLTTNTRGTENSTTTKSQINDAILYDVISNSIVNSATNGIAITNLPPDGVIVFNPSGDDGTVTGTFYVTNKTGFFFPLSGVDTNGNYYSFIELDTFASDTTDTVGGVDLGFSGNFNGLETEKFNTSTHSGTADTISTAQFYVHDNPYSFNGGDNAGAFFGNIEAIQISGQASIKETFKNGVMTAWTLSLKGSGNAVVDDNQNNLITSGTVTISAQ
jgi:hypothetical protein